MRKIWKIILYSIIGFFIVIVFCDFILKGIVWLFSLILFKGDEEKGFNFTLAFSLFIIITIYIVRKIKK